MDMKAFVDGLFAKAKAAGLSAAEAYILDNDSFQAMAQNGEIAQYSVNTTRGLGFRGMLNGKMGYASTEAFDEQAIEQLVKGVVDSATLTEDTDEQFIYQGGEKAPALNLYNPALDEVSAKDKLDFALKMEQSCRDYDKRITKVGYNMVQSGKSTVRIVNSYGVDQQYTENYIGAYTQPVAESDGNAYTGFDLCFTRDIAKLSAEKIAGKASQHALDRIGASPVPSGSYQVLYTPDAMTDFMGVFSSAFSAESAQKGLSLLKGKLGESIAADCVTITDDPLLVDGFDAKPFDAEGVPCKKHVIVENGVFKTFLHNLKTAHKDGVESTGNAAKGGYSTAVRVAPTNFYYEPGKQTKDELIASIGSGLIVTELEGLHASADGVSGDFSLMAKGFVIKDGKQDRPVEQITVAGNFFQMLKNIRGFANDLTFPGGGLGSPSVWVGALDVAGK